MRIRDRLRSVALAVTGDREEAEDALQDVFIKLWCRRERLSNSKEVELLLRTSVRNESIDHLRKRKPTVGPETVESLSDTLTDDNDGDERQRVQNVYDTVILTARNRLNANQFKVFELHDIQGLTYPEIAQELSMTEENVRVTLSRARKTIRELYRQHINFKE